MSPWYSHELLVVRDPTPKMTTATSIRTRTPRAIRNALKVAVEAYGSMTSALRLMPDYIIIGGQRCGTTSLYQYLTEHPGIGSSSTKEVHYFDVNYQRGVSWYRGHFPTVLYREFVRLRDGLRVVTGEASPYYLFHPHAAPRAAALVPDATLIVILRNPVERALSHYHHEVSLGFETLPSFEEAIEREPDRLAGERERMIGDPGYASFHYQHSSYLARGIYADQLQQWFEFFPRDRFLILIAERFFEAPADGFRRVLDRLGLMPHPRSRFPPYNAQKYSKLEPALRTRLQEYFAPHNQRLYELVGEDFGWDG